MSVVADGRWTGPIRESIRAGRPPTASAVALLAGAERARLGDEGVARATGRLTGALLGAGPLEGVLADPGVTDVLVNGDGSVWVDRGGGVVPAGPGTHVDDVRALATRLAGLARRRLDDAQPWVDGQLPSGVRLHAVLPPLVDGGAHISLRVPRHHPRGVDGLVGLGAVDRPTAELLRSLVAARVAFVVTGGTGAGKTTVLGALLAECPPAERIVLVEDVRELAPDHPHVVRLQGRSPNVEGVGAVSMVDLVRQALRMRPDRLVVGEVRGPEVREMLAALNTGHEGGCGTMHANSVEEVPARFEALGALAGMPRAAVHAQLRGAVRVVVHVRRRGSRRRVAQIGVTRATAAGEVEVVVATTVADDPGIPALPGPGWAALSALLSVSR